MINIIEKLIALYIYLNVDVWIINNHKIILFVYFIYKNNQNKYNYY